jgi:ribulose-5-phosphate 4-epimerase/fuculose-1-phosphate aldolase
MNRLDLHPFAQRLIHAGEELSRSGMAVGNNCQLTAFDEKEQLLWVTGENSFFSHLSSEKLNVFSVNTALQSASPLITHPEKLPHRHWETDLQLLLHIKETNVVLRCLTSYTLAWGQWAQQSCTPERCEELADFHPIFIPDLNDIPKVLAKIQTTINTGQSITCIFSGKTTPLILANSVEKAVTQQYKLETLCKSRIILEQLAH